MSNDRILAELRKQTRLAAERKASSVAAVVLLLALAGLLTAGLPLPWAGPVAFIAALLARWAEIWRLTR